MDETRHLASWIGGQEALHDRVLDLDEALAAVAAVEAAEVQRLAGELFRDDGSAARGRCPGPPPAGSRAPPAAAGVTAPPTTPVPAGDRRCPPTPTARESRRAIPTWSWPGSTSCSARSAWPGPSSRRWPDAAISTTTRSATWPRRAGGPVTSSGPARPRRPGSSGHPDDVLGLVIAAEAQAALGRPGEARRLAGRAMERADGSLDPVFAGMQRSAIWPVEPGAAIGPAGVLFDDLHPGPHAVRPLPTAARGGGHRSVADHPVAIPACDPFEPGVPAGPRDRPEPVGRRRRGRDAAAGDAFDPTILFHRRAARPRGRPGRRRPRRA